MNNNVTTPQRPQPKRRQRQQTLNCESLKLLQPQQSASKQQQRRTPQQEGRNAGQRLQRQHSVSCCTPTTGKLTPPQLMRFQKATGGSQYSLFSGSKFLDSPAPHEIPLPPSHWFSNVTDLTHVRTSPTPSAASDSLSSASSIESTSSDEFLSSGFEQRGFRMNPMQLIARISAVV